MDNYTVYHLHSDLSNGVTNIDSVTKYAEYIKCAKENKMHALGYTEHANTFEWWHKKCDVEAAGMKYIHGMEAYITETLGEKIRDNYHCVLIAKNYEGFLELNRLQTVSFNRNDNHFYYVPRISFEELCNTSDNIIVTSACIGGILGKNEENADMYTDFVKFLSENSHRTFLEIGHHADEKQVLYNQKLVKLSKKYGVPLIAGTDTHVLNELHEKGRKILQESKNIHFDDEDKWDLKFKTYDELVDAYKRQRAIDERWFMQAIENTNVMADMIEPFEIDCSAKYPHIYDDSENVFREKIFSAIESHPYALKNHSRDELEKTVEAEFNVYKNTGSIDFMLMQTYIRDWEKAQGIQCGYGRGSVSGSMIAYLLGITEMDSLRFGLNFFRFMNPARVSNADIDTDYSGRDRDKVKEFLLKDKMGLTNIRSAEIITFNTIALKGAIRDVCRALYKERTDINYQKLATEIIEATEKNEDAARSKYSKVFEYVDIVNGTIVSIGTHPSGVLVSDLPIDELVGLCSISSSDYPVSVINMKELDDQFFVKLDVLGLDNLGVINDTCKMLGIERLTPDSVDLEDIDVWRSIRDDTTLIFQWESNSAQAYIKRFMSDKTLEIAMKRVPNFSMIKWLSFGNGLIRPACASFRDSVANGEFYDNGFDALNDFLAPEAGRIAMQETIMRFLVEFCGYSDAESDNVRRGIAKKKGTEQLLPEIEERFIATCGEKYGMSKEESEKIIKPFLQVILDASAYAFSWNHSDAYSCVGYICGYLRYYHPLEFITAALNIFDDDADKTAQIAEYAKKVGIQITMPKWGYSRSTYFCDKEKNVIAKGLASIKYMNKKATDRLYSLARERKFNTFVDVLQAISNENLLDARQIEILIKIDFFSEFGTQRELLYICDVYTNLFKKGEAKKIRRETVENSPFCELIQRYSSDRNNDGSPSAFYTLIDIQSVLRGIDMAVKKVDMPDLTLIEKVKNFEEVTGYLGFITNKEEDRRKLFITDIKTLYRKKDHKQFGYSFFTKSIGSGKESRFTVFNNMYNLIPVHKGDIINCVKWERDGPYFQLKEYTKIE